MKKCRVCKVEKELKEFYANKRMADGKLNYCKTCFNEKQGTRFVKNRANKLRKDKYNAKEAFRLRCADTNLKSKFGISLNDYNRMEDEQGGVCAICGKQETYKFKGRTKRLAVDHDHATGKVRQLLCAACNKGIAVFHENPMLFQSAIRYVRKHKEEIAL